jgi:hypothetical protein
LERLMKIKRAARSPEKLRVRRAHAARIDLCPPYDLRNIKQWAFSATASAFN